MRIWVNKQEVWTKERAVTITVEYLDKSGCFGARNPGAPSLLLLAIIRHVYAKVGLQEKLSMRGKDVNYWPVVAPHSKRVQVSPSCEGLGRLCY